jgi:hypothetical protein
VIGIENGEDAFVVGRDGTGAGVLVVVVVGCALRAP